VINWLIALGFEFDEIASHYIEDFKLTKYDYEKAMQRQRLSAKNIIEDKKLQALRKGFDLIKEKKC
jgi:hypothetical protein